MQPLLRIAYASKATHRIDPPTLRDMLQRSSSANERNGLTGFLLHDTHHFFQVLEGPAPVVRGLFHKIRTDPRHEHVACILNEPLLARTFDEWSMAFTAMTRTELCAIEGLTDFFGDGATFMQLTAPQARLLLAAFADGRWRQSIAGRAVLGNRAIGDAAADASPGASTPWVSPCGLSYAYQPIVDTFAREVVSYEALIRGARGEAAFQVLGAVPPTQLHRFDADGRIAAIELAARLGLHCDLNLNFMPQSAFASPHILDSTLAAARRCGISPDRIVIEVTESEAIQDHRRFAELIDVYRHQGMRVAIDDFGAGHSGLNLLSEFQPDQIKVDIALVRRIEVNGPRQSIVRAIIGLCRELRIDVIAEGIESMEQLRWLEDEGLCLFQGHLFARPGFECLPIPSFPALLAQPRSMRRT
ncbi:MAG: diguanylate phosphodiesterase [Variovorax sp.]